MVHKLHESFNVIFQLEKRSLLLHQVGGNINYHGDDDDDLRSSTCIPPDVPEDHLVIYSGYLQPQRFVIRTSDLNHPLFKMLLDKAEEEFG
ncbi:hypothetical protein KI387_022232, partial [Taxus chinensis]